MDFQKKNMGKSEEEKICVSKWRKDIQTNIVAVVIYGCFPFMSCKVVNCCCCFTRVFCLFLGSVAEIWLSGCGVVDLVCAVVLLDQRWCSVF